MFLSKKPVSTMATKKPKREVGIVKHERRLKHYSSNHQILLVGEGDFSFSLCLAKCFGSATNISATSLDLYDEVVKKYKKAKLNLESLEKLGASLLHGVDATKMKHHSDFKMRKFDRIIFNFPHAGFRGKEHSARLIKMHKGIVYGFFRNASGMLRANGEIHVSHKTKAPFCHWNLEELASKNSLALIECVNFKTEDYPGYNNKRGDGLRCDEHFHLGECSAFKFRLSPAAKKTFGVKTHLDFTHGRPQHCQEIPIEMQQQPTSFGLRHLQTNFNITMNGFRGYVGSPLTVNIRRESPWIPNGCFNHVADMYGRNGNDMDCFRRYMAEAPGRTLDDVDYFGNEALWLDSSRYIAEAPGRNLNGYTYLVDELHHPRSLRSARLPRISLGYDHYRRF